MLYMVQTFARRETWDADMAGWPRERAKALVDFMNGVNEDLKQSGELVETRGLGGPGTVTSVMARSGDEPETRRGPLQRTGDILTGYWVVDVRNFERAVEIAARISAAPGPGGEQGHFPVEVHEIPSGPPF